MALGIEYAVAPGVSSVIATVPAVTLLLSLLVVCENAENAPVPATAPAKPTIASERRVLRRVEMVSPFAGKVCFVRLGYRSGMRRL